MRSSKYLIKLLDSSGLFRISVLNTVDYMVKYSRVIRSTPGPIRVLDQLMMDHIKYAISTYKCNVIKSNCDAATKFVKELKFGG